MIYEWPVKPIECFSCYDLGVVIDPFKQNERAGCKCQEGVEAEPLDSAGQKGEMKNVQQSTPSV